MALVNIEILVKCQIPMNERGMQQYDIITVQPSGTPWGTGDLQGKLVFALELDLPCGLDFMAKKRCSQCEHYGIAWESENPTAGTKGVPRETCPVQKYIVPDAIFEMALNIHNYPYVKQTLNKKRKHQLNYSQLAILKPKTISKVESEKLITESEKNLRLIDARKINHKISETIINSKETK